MAKEQRFFGTSRGLGPHASRRGLLQAGLAIGTLALGQRAALGQSGGAHAHMPELGVAKLPVVPAMDQPLVEPEVRRSVNGVLSTSLSCAYAYRDIGGKRLYLRSYEGGLGPTLRMKPGETLKIRLTNGFPPNRDLVPRDLSRRGTYWYHPHHHGSADVQVASGMAGAIIVEGDFANVPEIVQARERVMLLAQVVFDAFSMVEDFVTVFPESSTRFLAINGQRRPTIDMRPGEVQRWRLLGSQYQNYMLLELDQHRLNVIAYDGIQLGTVQEMKQLLIAPGQRADVLVQAGGPGTYELNAMPFDQVHPMSAGPLARVVVAGEPLPMKLPAALPKPPLETIRDSEITCRRTLVLSTIGDPPENDPGGQWQEFTLMIDGKTFDPSRIDQRVRLGAVEEWTIRNPDLRDDHAFHIHVNPFQVTQVNGQPQADLQWRDTVLVPRKGSVVLRSRFLDYTGVFMLHCHMMNHEEMGMMQAIEVYKEADGPIVYEGVVYDADSICSSRGK